MTYDAIHAALVARDGAALTDALVALDAADPAALATVHDAAERAFAELADVDFAPEATVNDVVAALAHRAGLGIGRDEIDRRFADGPSRADRVATAGDGALRAALAAAYARIAALEAERAALEERVAELAGARVLADTLAEELERDEWIRARLRRLKATPPLRAAIKLRKALRRGRGRAPAGA